MQLTKRQLEIMNLVKLGHANKQIAIELSIGAEAVAMMMSRNIFPRLGARDRAHAVYICMKMKLID